MNLATGEMFKKIRYSDENSIELSGSLLRQCQLVMLSIAEDVISVCEKEGFWYQLGGGTALGAIRHNGFIPWDDDIDLNMMRKDYESFLEKFTRSYGEKYDVHTCRTPEYGLPICRVRLKNSVYRVRDDIEADECGFFVEIFILENVFDNVILRYLHGAVCMVCGGLLSCRKFYRNRKFMREVVRQNPETKKTIYAKIGLGWLVSFLSLRRWALITDAVYGLCKNNRSKYVTFPSGRKHYFGEMRLREDIVNTIPVPFEGHRWQVAQNYDAYFTALYGPNYMIPHTKAEQERHIILELKFPKNFGQSKADETK